MIFYGLLAAIVCYFALRNTRSIWLHALLILVSAVLVGVATVIQFHVVYPSSGFRSAIDARNAALPMYFVGGVIASIAGPLAGAVLASLGRKASLSKKPAIVLIAGALLCAVSSASRADDLGNMIKWEKESRNSIPHTKKKVPAARVLVVKANSLLKGDPTCAQMLQASKLLDKAGELYIDANEVGGDVRNLTRRVSWLEEVAKAGKCRKGS